jgi:hypothetical protein
MVPLLVWRGGPVRIGVPLQESVIAWACRDLTVLLHVDHEVLDASTPARTGRPRRCGVRLRTTGFDPRAYGADPRMTPRTSDNRFDPRACGADSASAAPRIFASPRPPRVRGGQVSPGQVRPGQASTPARAGRTERRSQCSRSGSFDPRACGADVISSSWLSRRALRPPRVRGGRVVSLLTGFPIASTPARAGRTLAELLNCRCGGLARVVRFRFLVGRSRN